MTPLRTLAETAATPQAVHQLWDAPPADGSEAGVRFARQLWEPAFVPSETGATLDEPYTILGNTALRAGEVFLALDIVREGCARLETYVRQRSPATPVEAHAMAGVMSRLGHIEALALARTGSTHAAQERLAALYAQDKHDPEIVGALARTYKDFAMGADPDSDAQRRCLERSHSLYLEGYRRSAPPSVFLGVNAAATALWLGDRAAATALSREVETLCRAPLAATPDDYWLLATLGEVCLLQGHVNAAIDHYAAARAVVNRTRHWADLSTTALQARRHCARLELDPAPIEAALRVPRLAVFAGHMIDGPERTIPRFPDDPALIARIAEEIRAWLEREEVGFAQCSAACGADLIFIDQLSRRGAEIHVVMPWREADFIASSVRPGGEHWVREYERLRREFRTLTCLTQQTLPSAQGLGFDYCNHCINGMALLRAGSLDAEIRPLAVWDGLPGDGPGGTASFVDFWHYHAPAAEVIPLPAASSAIGSESRAAAARSRLSRPRGIEISRGVQVIKTLLFADVVGYSRINESQIEHFAPRFLGAVSTLIARADGHQPILTNTWGDALYLVFDEASHAGEFALRLREMIQSTPWSEHGLPGNLNVRIGLHTGPVLLCIDPVIRQMTFTGSHVSHAARIEPVVETGEIFATEAFAAYLEVARRGGEAVGFRCDYLGQLDFAKGYGRYPLFRVRETLVAEGMSHSTNPVTV